MPTTLTRHLAMKVCFISLLILVVACAPIVDTRTPAQIAATRTAKALLPAPPLPGMIRVRLFPTETPEPDWEYTVTPTPKASE